ncbi:conserved hypothetical protein [Vibrio chagasii]|nr:conserved hypothetical protein [Vibrio chagasii]CAH6817470.1 conserved hypothetical protein [Vibrio chagasii]CAH6824685.1 conserved hypothetical protein [Vibrio chagasii]CAH6923205.1 conserved hypothetical protein [Vibrio chagasii]CAH6970255.1 conserved hypothetical protein [Vibrio chagasii]
MRIIVLAFAALATACTSQIISTEEHILQYIGSDITDVQERYLTERSRPISFWESRNYAWIETKKPLDNGYTVHAFKNPYRDCTINWVADTSGVIQSATSTGTMCEP